LLNIFMSRVSARSDHIDEGTLKRLEEDETRRGNYNDWNHATRPLLFENLIPSNDESM
ncbi:Hypothetical protein FKW44_011851, partial [Caligus rogercresseyi]